MNKQPNFEHHEVKWTEKSSERLWDYYSSSSAHRDKYFGNKCGRQVARLLSRKLLSKVKIVLDYSCGRGDLLLHCVPLLKPQHQIHACDMSTTSIRETSTKLAKIPQFGKASVVKSLPSGIPSNNFDLVLATEVLEHLNNTELQNTLQDIARITRTSGFVFVTTPYQENLAAEKTACPDCGCIFHRWQHQRSWNKKELQSTMELYGFQTVECDDILWAQWPLRLYYWFARRPGNGIYYIGKKVS